ncbi:MAG: hypothetical protein Q7U83_15755, partial [Daejeonella sp.]|nr:hypothetical protein [Daejeonella sp.]
KIPFREAHELTGKIVLYCIKNKKELKGLSINEFKKFSSAIAKDIYSRIRAEDSIKAKTSRGGTAPSEVKKQLKRLKQLIK